MVKLNKPVAKNPDKAMTGKMRIIYRDHPDFEKMMEEGKIATGEPSDAEKQFKAKRRQAPGGSATPDPKAISRFVWRPGDVEITKPGRKR